MMRALVPPTAVRCVFASLDTRAPALYLKFEMYPRGMFNFLKGAPRRVPRPSRSVDLVPIGTSAGRRARC